MDRTERIEVVNQIIKEIASRSRRFFYNRTNDKIAYIYEKNGRLYMMAEWHSEWSKPEIYLHPKYGYSPRNFTHGGTLWGLTKDFKEFIMKGGDTNHNNGYGGLFCSHWGYSDVDMKAIQKLAFKLGYLKQENI